MNVCAAYHARRSTIAEGGLPGAPLEDTHRPALLTPPLYYPDGQQREEVYVWGSFRQSKMFERGVTCMDCHEPHALKLRAEGNALCANCHNPGIFDTDKHHFHKMGTKGAQCVECHMPAQNYMLVQARRDHSIRVPRPDLSPSLGSPNACNSCHAGRNPEWAAAAMDRWYGSGWRDRRNDGPILHAAGTQGAKALPGLLDLARDTSRPGIVRATAATLAQAHMRPDSLRFVPALLADSDPLVRVAALEMVEAAAPAVRLALAAPLLRDTVRGVRLEAARILADLPDDRFPGEAGRDRERALREYVESLQLNAGWPTANVNRGNLYVRQGRVSEAQADFERAVSLDPSLVGAYGNLADLYRQQSREADAEDVLRRGLTLLPRAPDLHHALGLLLVRKADRVAAIDELGEAAKLAPNNPRYAYVYAIGLHAAGRRGDALAVLREADARHPYNLEILNALISVNREAGDAKAALVYARKFAEILPDDAGVKRLVDELTGAK